MKAWHATRTLGGLLVEYVTTKPDELDTLKALGYQLTELVPKENYVNRHDSSCNSGGACGFCGRAGDQP